MRSSLGRQQHFSPPPSTQQQHGPKQSGPEKEAAAVPFEVGDVVFVQDRTWPGMNDPGGVARVLGVHRESAADGGVDGAAAVTYDVRYVVGRNRSMGVEAEHVSPHVDYVSPSKVCGAGSVVAGSRKVEEKKTVEEEERNVPRPAEETSSSGGGRDTSGVTDDGARNDKGRREEKATSSTSTTDSPDHVDEDGHPLSEYERLRLRNIQRNRARLAELGLLAPSSDKPSAKGGSGKPKKSKQPSHEVERRTQPKRGQAAKGGGDKRSKSDKDATAAAPDLQANRAGSEGENSIASAKSTRTAGAAFGANDNEGSSRQHCDRPVDSSVRKQRTEASDARPPNMSGVTSTTTTALMEAAKAGCRKCTLEWQTERADPTIDHDICCPRVGKKTPPPPPQATSRERQAANSRDGDAIRNAKSRTAAARQPTPSPLLARRKDCQPSSQRPAPLPAWIKEFIAEADQHNETVPAPRGSKWLPCPNPWGKIGHEEGDFVVVSPFQSETASDLLSVFHQGRNGSVPKRFVANPLEEGSPYHATHRSPARGGYSVLLLRRDRTSHRPWGFSVRLHEFGGACLVDSIEPLSPAEAAVSPL